METILSWVLTAIAIFAVVAGIYLYWLILHPLLLMVRKSLETGVYPSKEEIKKMVIALGVDAVLVLILPFIGLVVIRTSLELAYPEMTSISDLISTIFLDVFNEVNTGADYIDDGTQVTQPQAIQEAPVQAIEYYPTVAPTQVPQQQVLVATPTLAPNAPIYVTPTPTPVQHTLQSGGGTP